MRELYKRLSEPFPEEAVERTKASVTRKGYDTTGIKYQYVVDRLNEVLGVGCYRTDQEFHIREFERRNNYKAYDVTCDITLYLGEWKEGGFVPFAEVRGTGGHVSNNVADAKKGAYTNGFKKTAAMLGVGSEAYRGTIDDDNVPGIGVERPLRGNNGGNDNSMAGRLRESQERKPVKKAPRKGGNVPPVPGVH